VRCKYAPGGAKASNGRGQNLQYVEILNQLGGLFLSAVPTIIIVFLFYLFRARAEGARQQAESTRAAAQERLRTYQEALRKARVEIFSEQEAARRRALEERQAAVQQARLVAQQEVQAAKKSLAVDVEAARAQLEQSGAALAGEIAEAILAGGSAGPAGRLVPGEAR
jgi:F0F1-type ATP synthase membrane subunit b/b'